MLIVADDTIWLDLFRCRREARWVACSAVMRLWLYR